MVELAGDFKNRAHEITKRQKATDNINVELALVNKFNADSLLRCVRKMKINFMN
jgi:hypothetical protein